MPNEREFTLGNRFLIGVKKLLRKKMPEKHLSRFPIARV